MTKLPINIPEFTTNLRPYNLASCEVANMLLYLYEIVQKSFYNNILVKKVNFLKNSPKVYLLLDFQKLFFQL